jgi:polyhydroxyalkanoate synthesis regulator phasin
MRNREATLRKLDSVESNLTKLIFTLNQGDRNASHEVIENLREQVEQLKLYIASEPLTGSELN